MASYSEYMATQSRQAVRAVHLVTPDCHGDHHKTTVEWMRHSRFCVQPPGDSATRKSFYDAILSGCIPVLTSLAAEPPHYAFESVVRYKKLTLIVQEKQIRQGVNIIDLLAKVSQWQVRAKQLAIKRLARYLQYDSVFGGATRHKDAIALVLSELEQMIPDSVHAAPNRTNRR